MEKGCPRENGFEPADEEGPGVTQMYYGFGAEEPLNYEPETQEEPYQTQITHGRGQCSGQCSKASLFAGESTGSPKGSAELQEELHKKTRQGPLNPLKKDKKNDNNLKKQRSNVPSVAGYISSKNNMAMRRHSGLDSGNQGDQGQPSRMEKDKSRKKRLEKMRAEEKKVADRFVKQILGNLAAEDSSESESSDLVDSSESESSDSMDSDKAEEMLKKIRILQKEEEQRKLQRPRRRRVKPSSTISKSLGDSAERVASVWELSSKPETMEEQESFDSTEDKPTLHNSMRNLLRQKRKLVTTAKEAYKEVAKSKARRLEAQLAKAMDQLATSNLREKVQKKDHRQEKASLTEKLMTLESKQASLLEVLHARSEAGRLLVRENNRLKQEHDVEKDNLKEALDVMTEENTTLKHDQQNLKAAVQRSSISEVMLNQQVIDLEEEKVKCLQQLEISEKKIIYEKERSKCLENKNSYLTKENSKIKEREKANTPKLKEENWTLNASRSKDKGIHEQEKTKMFLELTQARSDESELKRENDLLKIENDSLKNTPVPGPVDVSTQTIKTENITEVSEEYFEACVLGKVKKEENKPNVPVKS
jgi:hypothetical protein